MTPRERHFGVLEKRFSHSFLDPVCAPPWAFFASPMFGLWFMIIVIIGGRGLLVLGVGSAVKEANALGPPVDLNRKECD